MIKAEEGRVGMASSQDSIEHAMREIKESGPNLSIISARIAIVPEPDIGRRNASDMSSGGMFSIGM